MKLFDQMANKPKTASHKSRGDGRPCSATDIAEL
jgi:hypothetical protein